MAVLFGSCEDMALKIGRSGNVEAIRICCDTVKLLQLGLANLALDDRRRRKACASMIENQSLLPKAQLVLTGELHSGERHRYVHHGGYFTI